MDWIGNHMWAPTHTKLASPVKQNLGTVTVKYTYYCECCVVSDTHHQPLSDSSKKSASIRHLPKHQAGTKCNVLHDTPT